MPKLCPKIILEGTRLTFETGIALALNEQPRIAGPRKYRYHSPIISAEWCGFTPIAWGQDLINFEPQEEERTMETYRTWLRPFELLRYYSWIVDRFHLFIRMYQLQTIGKDHDFRWLEERLHPRVFHLVFCTRPPGSFAAARADQLKVSVNPSQYDALPHFIDEQELMRRPVGESILPTLEPDVSDNDVLNAVHQIADWLAETDGLYAPS